MLETIKHLFGIANLVFVISIDKTQLSKSIQAVYGQIDTQNYLRRFFDLEFILPKSTKGFLTYLNKTYNLQTIKMEDIVKTDNFSLRGLEHFASQIRLLELFNKDNKFNIIHASFILFVKMQDESLYRQMPHIEDIEPITHIAEKLASGKILYDVFKKYLEIIYVVCNMRIYENDSAFLLKPNDFRMNTLTQKIERKRDTMNYEELLPNTLSYVVYKHYHFLKAVGFKDDFKLITQRYEILKAIDFVSQFK